MSTFRNCLQIAKNNIVSMDVTLRQKKTLEKIKLFVFTRSLSFWVCGQR